MRGRYYYLNYCLLATLPDVAERDIVIFLCNRWSNVARHIDLIEIVNYVHHIDVLVWNCCCCCYCQRCAHRLSERGVLRCCLTNSVIDLIGEFVVVLNVLVVADFDQVIDQMVEGTQTRKESIAIVFSGARQIHSLTASDVRLGEQHLPRVAKVLGIDQCEGFNL